MYLIRLQIKISRLTDLQAYISNYEIINILLFHNLLLSNVNSYYFQNILLFRLYYFSYVFAIYFSAIDMRIDVTFIGDSI